MYTFFVPIGKRIFQKSEIWDWDHFYKKLRIDRKSSKLDRFSMILPLLIITFKCHYPKQLVISPNNFEKILKIRYMSLRNQLC